MKLAITEHDIQKSLVQLVALKLPRTYPFLHSIPNQMKPEQIGRKKAEGMRAGVSDLFLAKPVVFWNENHSDAEIWHGLYLEAKTPGGSLSNEQKNWLALVYSVGYGAAVFRSAEEGLVTIEKYLAGERS